jgi:hypothetical protein
LNRFTRSVFVLAILSTGSRLAAAGEASAHDPRYGDRAVWPAWVEKTDFARETWPKARLLVYAHAGADRRGVDLTDPSNWIEDGKPAAQPPDQNTDIVFPSAAKRYGVNGEKGCTARHMTVEAGVSAFMDAVLAHGNVWIEDGGSFQAVQPRGARNTFMRNDTPKPNQAANKIAFNKPSDRSTEWIGIWRLGDELDLFSGRFVVAPDSTFLAGDRSTQHIYPNGTLVLHSGSTFQKRGNQYWGHEMEVVGQVLAGTPERPLTKDCTLALSFKAKGRFRLSKPDDRGLVLYREGRLAVHSADPAAARLVFRRNPLPAQSHTFPGGKESPEVAAMPHGIDLLLLGNVELDGVEFNDILTGGILMPDPAQRKAWRNVFFSEGNFAEGDALFAKYTGPMDRKMEDTGIAADLIRKGIEPGQEP